MGNNGIFWFALLIIDLYHTIKLLYYLLLRFSYLSYSCIKNKTTQLLSNWIKFVQYFAIESMQLKELNILKQLWL